MSRLGKMPVKLGKASAKVDGQVVTVSAGNAELSYECVPQIRVTLDEDSKSLVVALADGVDEKVKQNRAHWGTTRSRIQNLVEGVTKGYEKRLEVVGVGYQATVAGQNLQLKVGYANTLSVPIPPGVDVSVENQIISVKGADKQAVGQFAAVVRRQKPPEPYNGKGIMYQGEQIIRKQGKTFGN